MNRRKRVMRLIGTILITAISVAAITFAFEYNAKSSDDSNSVSVIPLIELSAEIKSTEPVLQSNTKAAPLSDSIKHEEEILYYSDEEITMLAKLLYHECRGVPSDTEKACVVWTVLNRVDSEDFKGDTISEVITQPHQFSYIYDTPVWDNLYDLALDVLTRWNSERNGNEPDGRVLPNDYFYFHGDGSHNYFRNKYSGGEKWDYSLTSPYES